MFIHEDVNTAICLSSLLPWHSAAENLSLIAITMALARQNYSSRYVLDSALQLQTFWLETTLTYTKGLTASCLTRRSEVYVVVLQWYF